MAKKLKTETEKPQYDSLRPERLGDYIGQTKVKTMLRTAITAAKNRNEALRHALFYGPPGLGKTTIARIIANEMGVPFHSISAPILEKTGDAAALLNKLEERSVLFIDEIHRMDRHVEEFLYSAMEDYKISITIGEGATLRSITINLPMFTLIGATTLPSMLTGPFRDRFGIVGHMEFYSKDELVAILNRSAERLKVGLDPGAALLLASGSRGTPRIANTNLQWARDIAQNAGHDGIGQSDAKATMAILGIDGNGLNKTDRGYLRTVVNLFDGGPVGLETLAATMGEDAGTLERVIEPYLLQEGYIKRTPRGRVISDTGKEMIREDIEC